MTTSRKSLYKELPKGFFDREESWLRIKRSLLHSHHTIGNSFNCSLIETSPLGFAATYTKSCNTAGEKVYDFLDKAQRHIYLACDSTPGVLRYYTATYDHQPQRFAFTSPLFRYRDGPTRHFTQLGYASINEPFSANDTDFVLLDLAKGIIELARSVNLDITVDVSDFSILRSLCLKGGIEIDTLPTFLKRLQFSDPQRRIELLSENIESPDTMQTLLDILVHGKKPDGLFSVLEKFAKALELHAGVKVTFSCSDMHSIETISGIALRFITTDGVYIGDGGQYSTYGQAFDANITSLRSVATGAEVLARNAKLVQPPALPPKIVVLGSPEVSDAFLVQVIAQLQGSGMATQCYGHIVATPKLFEKLAKQGIDLLSVVNSVHEQERRLNIKHLQSKLPSFTKSVD